MANLRGKMKKLQTAILKRGMVVKINQSQFYSTEPHDYFLSHYHTGRVLQSGKEGMENQRLRDIKDLLYGRPDLLPTGYL